MNTYDTTLGIFIAHLTHSRRDLGSREPRPLPTIASHDASDMFVTGTGLLEEVHVAARRQLHVIVRIAASPGRWREIRHIRSFHQHSTLRAPRASLSLSRFFLKLNVCLFHSYKCERRKTECGEYMELKRTEP